MAGIELLTDKAIRAALKAATAAGKPGKVTDGGGLYLETKPTGAGWWRLRYWIAGKENRLSLGTYPEVTLARARERRREAMRQIAEGIDPSQHRKAEREALADRVEAQRLAAAGLPLPGTFEHVAREWLTEKHEASVTPSHAARTKARLEQNVFPWLGSRPIGEIEPPVLLQCLRRVEARGAIETAHRVKDACGQVFRYGIVTGRCARNPAADLRDALKPVPTRHHAAIVDPAGTAKLLRDMMDYAGQPVTRAALQLSALLLLRPGELRQTLWAEIDLDGATLTIPSERMKGKLKDKATRPPHVVPLARQSVAILRDLHPLTSRSRYVFPALTTIERCMSENTVNVSLRRMGYDRETMTAHGFRAMARTLIAERLDVSPEVIEAQLAHTVADPLGRAYNRTQFLEQRRTMMQRWADHLDSLSASSRVS